jgi:hypothetical protein
MEKIIIEGKEHSCSKKVKEEIEWQDIRIANAIKLSKEIDDLMDEIRIKQSKIQDLIGQIINI